MAGTLSRITNLSKYQIGTYILTLIVTLTLTVNYIVI